ERSGRAARRAASRARIPRYWQRSDCATIFILTPVERERTIRISYQRRLLPHCAGIPPAATAAIVRRLRQAADEAAGASACAQCISLSKTTRAGFGEIYQVRRLAILLVSFRGKWECSTPQLCGDYRIFAGVTR